MALYVVVPAGLTVTVWAPRVGEYQEKTTLRLVAVDAFRLTTFCTTPSIAMVIAPRFGPFGATMARLRPVKIIESFALVLEDPRRVPLYADEVASFCQFPALRTLVLRSS